MSDTLIYRIDYSYLKNEQGKYFYIIHPPMRKYCERYDKWVSTPANYPSDGASGFASDVGIAWLWHDRLCEQRKWEDGSECTAWQASMFLKDCLTAEGRSYRAVAWAIATWAWQKARGHQ